MEPAVWREIPFQDHSYCFENLLWSWLLITQRSGCCLEKKSYLNTFRHMTKVWLLVKLKAISVWLAQGCVCRYVHTFSFKHLLRLLAESREQRAESGQWPHLDPVKCELLVLKRWQGIAAALLPGIASLMALLKAAADSYFNFRMNPFYLSE